MNRNWVTYHMKLEQPDNLLNCSYLPNSLYIVDRQITYSLIPSVG